MRTLILLGSGEFTNAMEDVDMYLLSRIKSQKTVAILPTASGLENKSEKWIQDGIHHFKKLQAHPVGIPAITREDMKNPDYTNTIQKSDWIYFSGGEPDYLEKTLRETPVWNTIIKRYQQGVFLAGSSAGAIVMGSVVLENTQDVFFERTKTIRFRKAFSLIPYSIIPHFDRIQKEGQYILDKVLHLSPKHAQENWIGIDENTAMIISNEKNVLVLGGVSVLVTKKNKQTKYKKGDTFLL